MLVVAGCCCWLLLVLVLLAGVCCFLFFLLLIVFVVVCCVLLVLRVSLATSVFYMLNSLEHLHVCQTAKFNKINWQLLYKSNGQRFGLGVVASSNMTCAQSNTKFKARPFDEII